MAKRTVKTQTAIPKHIALIMDGNGRWAKKRMLPRSMGHKAGMERMVGLIEHAFAMGVDYMTVYALSTENLKRPKQELDGLYDLIRNYFVSYMARICANGIRLRIIGNVQLLPEDVQEILRKEEEKTAHFTGKGLQIALCYGARDEIVRAVNAAVQEKCEVTQQSFAKLLYTAEVPDPDLMVRTGGEVRLSNFLLYQSAYTELYFSKVMFPAFSNRHLEKAIRWFGTRVRRFGKTDEQLQEGNVKTIDRKE